MKFLYSIFYYILVLGCTCGRTTGSTRRENLAFLGPVVQRVQNDLMALTRLVTARHILLPKNDRVALALKQQIRDQSRQQDRFIVDVFEEAARTYSRDDTTKGQGGLIGELVPQGYCSRLMPEVDRACFQVNLGSIEGPIESSWGYHLLLISERTNCPKLDGTKTKLVPTSPTTRIRTQEDTPDNEVRSGAGSSGMLVEAPQVGRIDDIGKLIADVFFFGVFVALAGGITAEVAAYIGNYLQTVVNQANASL